jgi:predicted ATPase
MTKEQPPEFSSGYLALDDADDRPLIIDQPEENLDPKSIFDELIGLFVRAKHKRQVIMVTHNANLVVIRPAILTP